MEGGPVNPGRGRLVRIQIASVECRAVGAGLILCLAHIYQLRSQGQDQGGLDFTGMSRGAALAGGADLGAPGTDHAHGVGEGGDDIVGVRNASADHLQDGRILAMGIDENKFAEAVFAQGICHVIYVVIQTFWTDRNASAPFGQILTVVAGKHTRHDNGGDMVADALGYQTGDAGSNDIVCGNR